MSRAAALDELKEKGYADRVIVFEANTATVALAAAALGVEPGRIAKTLSFVIDGKPLLILAEGAARIDNPKYKQTFGAKAKMIPRIALAMGLDWCIKGALDIIRWRSGKWKQFKVI